VEPVRPGGQFVRPRHLGHADPDDQRAAAIANKGSLLQPQVAKALVSNGQMHPLPVRKLGDALTPETAHTLTRMMVYTVENYANGKKLVPGFGWQAKPGLRKSGAGRLYQRIDDHELRRLPAAADPQIVVLVKLDEPKKSRWAEAVACRCSARLRETLSRSWD